MLDDALGDLAGLRRVVDAQVVLPLVELPTGIELLPCVGFEQVAPGRIEVTPRRLLGQARYARIALQPLSLAASSSTNSTCAALAECIAAWPVSGFTTSPARLARGWRPRPA